MSPATRTKKLQAKLKKKQRTTQPSGASSKRAQSRVSQQDAAIGTLNSDPKKLTQSERAAAVQSLNRDIDSAKNLPPAEAGILLRAAQFLRQVLLELDGQNSDAENRNGQEQQASGTDATVLKKAVNDFNKAKEKVKDAISDAGPGEAASCAVARVAGKKPEEMTKGDLRQAIAEVEKAIEDGKVLLPADASLLQRALYALRMALFELGGVDPQLAVKDKEALEQLIDAKISASSPDPVAKHNLTKAIDDVKRAQSQIQNKQGGQGERPSDTADRAFDSLKTKKPEELSASELQEAIDEIEKSVERGKVLLPENASLFLRALYALRLALFDLGGVDPELAIRDKDQLEELLNAKMESSNVEVYAAADANLKDAVNNYKNAKNDIQDKLDETLESPDLAKALSNPEEMTTTEIRQSVDAIDQYIKQAQGLLPEEASLFLRFAYLLKLALMNLAGLRREFMPNETEGVVTEEAADERIALDQGFRQAASDYKRAYSQVQDRL